jgi:dihydrofolate reductase
MPNVIAWEMSSLDGYFEGTEPWSLDWHETVWGEELEKFSLEQLDAAGALLFGRKTYEGMASYWSAETGAIADLMNALPKVAFSRTLTSADWNNTRLVYGDAEAEVAALKAQPGKDLFIFGSAELAGSLTRAGLIDEYRVCIAPILLGRGNPLWKESAPVKLDLLEARPLATGGVLLRYRPGA